jgi:hypothetical protein
VRACDLVPAGLEPGDGQLAFAFDYEIGFRATCRAPIGHLWSWSLGIPPGQKICDHMIFEVCAGGLASAEAQAHAYVVPVKFRGFDKSLRAVSGVRYQPCGLERSLEKAHVLMNRSQGHLCIARQFSVVQEIPGVQRSRLHEHPEALQVSYGLKIAQIALEVCGDITIEPERALLLVVSSKATAGKPPRLTASRQSS